MQKIKRIYRKFANWMDFNPPGALSMEGWSSFKKEFKEKAPVRYWIKHRFRRKVILPIKWKYDKVTDWFRYRTYNRYHIVKTGLEPGYYGVDERMLHSSFNLLKNFVEVELAWNSYIWSDDYKLTFAQKYIPFYRKIKRFRSRELGLKHLDWASTLDDPSLQPHQRCDHQAVAAREIKALYLWWVDERPARKLEDMPEYNDQGLGILGVLDPGFNRNADDFKKHEKIAERNRNLEEEWIDEDTEMFIRLVKVRGQLWT